jgi:hypothetical protein
MVILVLLKLRITESGGSTKIDLFRCLDQNGYFSSFEVENQVDVCIKPNASFIVKRKIGKKNLPEIVITSSFV